MSDKEYLECSEKAVKIRVKLCSRKWNDKFRKVIRKNYTKSLKTTRKDNFFEN